MSRRAKTREARTPDEIATLRREQATNTPISQLMTREVICVRPELSIDALRRLFLEKGLHGAPVTDAEGELIGFISVTDLIRASASSKTTPDSTVSDVMMPLAISLEETVSVTVAAALMSFEGLHRIPVVSATGELVGILSALDVLTWLAGDEPVCAPLVRSRLYGPEPYVPTW